MENKDFAFPRELYLRYFSGIDDICFTHREIDVIACLVNARRTSKIASLLSIAPTTVTTHIQNIMRKIGCNSQEGIIDFIEKSQNLNLLKRYYVRLVSYSAFEKSLRRCSFLKSGVVSDLIICCKDRKQKGALAYFLQSHLKLAGIEADVHIRAAKPKINHENRPDHPHLLLKEKDECLRAIKEFPELALVDIRDEMNYYFCVFEILRKLLPKHNLTPIISEFKRSYEAIESLHESLPHSIFAEDSYLNQKATFPEEKKLSEKEQYEQYKLRSFLSLRGKTFYVPIYRNLFLALVLFVIGFVGNSFLTYYRNTEDKHAYISSTPGELEYPLVRSDGILPKESVFLQRSDLLADIDKKLKRGKAIQTVAFVGPGGTGKTTLARQYAYQQKAHIIWELNAETAECLKISFESLAEALARKEEDKKLLRAIEEIEKAEEKESKIIQFVKEKLKAYPNWILIYDNLETFPDLKRYFPQNAETWGSGKVIITTRNSMIQNNPVINHVLPIGPLNEAQKYDLFCKIIEKGEKTPPTASQEKEIKEFLQAIPPFPLDVSIAAHYLSNTHTSYNQYLKSSLQSSSNFVALQENLLKESGDYTKTRYQIISLSIQRIMSISQDFQDLLLLVSLIDSQKIPRDLLDRYKDNEIVDHFIYHLKKYSLLINEPSAASQNPTLSFHRSTHAMLFNHLKRTLHLENKAQLLSSFSHILEQYMKDAIENVDLTQMGRIKSHLKTFLSQKDLLNEGTKGAIETELGCAYYYTHYHEAAKNLLTSGILKLNHYPCKENYRRLAQALSYLGNLHKELGEHQKAKDFLEESIRLYRQHDSQNHRGMIRVLAYLGDTYKNLGNHQKARDLLVKSMALSKKHFGSYQMGLARTMLYLGIVYRDLGDYKKSIPLLKESLVLFKKHAPENYIELGRALKYLGNTYRSLGRYEEARDFLEQSVLVCKKYLPENHITLGRSLVHLATIYKNLGNYEKAKSLLTQSLAIHQKVFGEESVRTAWVTTHLANIHREMGEYEKAKEYINRCLKTYVAEYGENKLRTSWVFMQWAYIYEDLKNYREAKETLEKALKVHKNHFEESHHKIATILFHLGNAYKGLGHYKQAILLLERRLQTYERHYGKDHIETAKILGSLGHLYLCTGNMSKAESIMNKALTILQHKKYPSQFLLYENLAELYLQKAKLEKNKGRADNAETFKAKAIHNFKQALAITQALFPENSAHSKRIHAMLYTLTLEEKPRGITQRNKVITLYLE